MQSIPVDKRIVLIRRFETASPKLLSKYLVYIPAGTREEWENMFQQPVWHVQDSKGRIFCVDPKQVAVTEFWLEAQAKYNYYKKGDKLPVTTSLPRFFDNKSFTQGILRKFDLTIPNVSVSYIPNLGNVIDGLTELIPGSKPICTIISKSPISRFLYILNTSVRDVDLMKIKMKLYDCDINPELSELKGTQGRLMLSRGKPGDRFFEFLFQNASQGRQAYLKPVLHTGCGMGVVRLTIEKTSFCIETSDIEFQRMLVENNGVQCNSNKRKVCFELELGQPMRELVKQVLVENYFPYYHNKLGNETTFLLEEGVLPAGSPTKIEFRFIVQKTDTGFQNTANFAKVGATDFVANLSLSGKPEQTKTVLTSVFMKVWPYLARDEVADIVEREIGIMKIASVKVFKEIFKKANSINKQNIGKDNYLCPSTMNLALGSVDFTPVFVPNSGIILRAVEVNTGTIALGGLKRVDPRAYAKVTALWEKNIVSACRLAFSENAPVK